jgi:hypothetical protein
MHNVLTTIIVRDLLCNVPHGPGLSMGVEPTGQTQEDEVAPGVLQLELP